MLSVMKIALPALAAAGTAFAQCSTSGTATIQNAGDATGLASCSTFSGSIAIATDTTEDIALDGIQVLDGNLVGSDNSNINRISASTLEEINGDMEFEGLTSLYAVDFPMLKKVTTLSWIALPNLQTIGFTASVEEAESIVVINTGLRSLEGINIQQARTLNITNNGYINEINMQIGNISESLTFADNNERVEVTLPNLIWATNLTFRSCGSISLPSLESLNGSLGLYTNGFESFSAPNLTTVGEAVAIVGNEELSNLTFPVLTRISDNLQIANNTALEEITFPELLSVGGAFDISGNMSTVETPKLEDVAGAFNLQSTGNLTEACAFYEGLQDEEFIRGKFVCEDDLVDPGTEGHEGTPQSDSDEEGAASTLKAMNGALGFAAMVAVFLL